MNEKNCSKKNRPLNRMTGDDIPSLKTANVPENRPSQKEMNHFPTIDVQVQAVGFREGNGFPCDDGISNLR